MYFIIGKLKLNGIECFIFSHNQIEETVKIIKVIHSKSLHILFIKENNICQKEAVEIAKILYINTSSYRFK